jgi:CheY-like chemotaxis protein
MEARDGEEALACVARERPDVVIMDLAMPRMDGITATRAIPARLTAVVLKHLG